MRLRRRRDGGGAVATYAAVLDGAHLWLDVDGAPPASVTLRDRDRRETVDLELPADLTGLSGSDYDVLVDGSGVAPPEPRPSSVSRTPLAPDGVSRWQVGADGGRLRLTRHRVAPTAELQAVDVRGDRLHLRIRTPDGVEAGSHLLLLDTDDQVLATVPVTAHDGLLESLVGVDDLPAGWFGVLRVAVGRDGGWVRVRRRGNDLADPNRAVLLPELYAEGLGELGAGRPRARLLWNPDGLLALRCLDPDDPR